MNKVQEKETDIIVIGSGSGGATIARQLAKAGKRVVILEKGKDWRKHPLYGTYGGWLLYADKGGLNFTQEGINLIRGIMAGGTTNFYFGSAAEPPEWLKNKYKVDIDDYVKQTVKELSIKPLPEELIGNSAKKCMEVANALGLNWHLLPKFMNVERCKKGFDCTIKCMLGCKCGAKWTANEYLDEAVAAGAELVTEAEVQEVTISDNQAVGVKGKMKRTIPFKIKGDIVILSAGGLGTPVILQKSGFTSAGRGLFVDPTVMTFGVSMERGSSFDPPMTVGNYDDTNGYIFAHLTVSWLFFPIVVFHKGMRSLWRWKDYRRMMGIMIKVKDDRAGGITQEGKVSKPMTESDEKRFEQALSISRKILMKAGCAEGSIFNSHIIGAHPSGTVRIGELVNENLETEVKNLFVCDASVFPEALGRPMVLALIGLGKRLSDYILKK